jgi:hypothetical protein
MSPSRTSSIRLAAALLVHCQTWVARWLVVGKQSQSTNRLHAHVVATASSFGDGQIIYVYVVDRLFNGVGVR